MTPKTLFYTGSTTKSFTAVAFSLLVNDPTHHPGLDYATPISSILPEDFVLSDDWVTKHVTFEDALCHRSGYPRHDMAAIVAILPVRSSNRIKTYPWTLPH